MTNDASVKQHYGAEPLIERVRSALEKFGLASGQIEWSKLSSLDQFHVRGIEATRELAAELSLTPTSTVLDVGSGLGGPARFLAAEHGCHVTGIDLSQSFVDVAQMLAERTGLADRATYRQADALQLPFDNGSFDRAWTQHVAMNIQDRPRLYGEIHRVLKPGGLLAIYDVVEGNEDDLFFPVPWARRPEISFLITSDAMRDILKDSGLEAVTWRDKTDAGIEWGTQQALRSAQPDNEPSQFGIGVVMGPEFAEMSTNMARNLREGRIRLVQAVLQRL